MPHCIINSTINSDSYKIREDFLIFFIGAGTPQSFPQPKVPPYASGIRFLTQGLSVYGFGVRDSTVLSTLFITTIGASHVYEKANSATRQ